jgi:hypothetical protein
MTGYATGDEMSDFVLAAEMMLPKMFHKVPEASSLGGVNCSITHTPSYLISHEIHCGCM